MLVSSKVPSPLGSHGKTNTLRLSFGTGTTTAMSLRTFTHGTVMWMPLAGRIEYEWVPSSRARTSSAHTPVPFTTARALTVSDWPSATITAPVTWTWAAVTISLSRAWLADARGVV